MALTIKASGESFDNAITNIAEVLFNILKDDAPNYHITRGMNGIIE